MKKQRHWMTLGMMLGALAGAPLLGCAAAPEVDPPDQARLTLYAYGGWGCHNCGYKNSPYLGKHDLSDFTLAAAFNGEGLVLLEIEDPADQRHAVGFNQDELQAETGGGVVAGVGLVGWTLIFATPDVPELRVEVLSHLAVPDWVLGNPIDTYGLAYQEPTGPGEYQLAEVCPGLGLDDTNVVFIADETYDDATNEVTPSVSGTITVACRGHAVSKLRFMGHGPNDGYNSDAENRQATLKMLTADYCGDGTSYTTVGQPLAWADALGLFAPPPLSIVDKMEARWDDSGALCLNTPRNSAYAREDIPCGLPKCEGNPADLDGGLWGSYQAP